VRLQLIRMTQPMDWVGRCYKDDGVEASKGV
jgi:hypothetical protein